MNGKSFETGTYAASHAKCLDGCNIGRSAAPGSLKMKAYAGHFVGGKTLEPAFRMHHHKMHVHRNLSHSGHRIYYAESEGDIGHERTVHHIQMNPVRAPVEFIYLRLEMQEVCGKQ